MAIEEILKAVGDFGPAQWWLLSFFCLVNVLSAFHYFAQTFINLSPNAFCKDLNCTEFVSGITDGNLNTLTTELGWISEEGWKAATVQSFFFIGSVFGTLILGILADIVGRLPMLAAANFLAVIGNALTIYLDPNIYCLSLARFVAGLATDTNFFMMYIIVMEYIRPSMRTFGLNLCIGVWYCVGCMATPWLALYCENWRSFLLTISVPMLGIPVFALFVPESAQWLISRGRIEEAIKCFKKVATFNSKEIPDRVLTQFKATSDDMKKSSKQTAGLSGLFKMPRLRRKTCILIFKTMVLTLCYDAMSRNIEGFGLDPLTMFTITSASIFPSCVVILLLQDKVGRKAMAVASLLLTGIFNFGQGMFLVFSKDLPLVGAIIGLIGRFMVNIAYNSGTQYAAELIPTQARGQGLATVHVVGYLAAFFSPHILYLANTWNALPEMILGVLSVAGALSCLFLPETLNQSLPVTLEDGEKFGENEKVWDFLRKKNVNRDDTDTEINTNSTTS